MTRLQKIFRNLIILLVLFFIFLWGSGLHLSPLAANRASEKSIHYGPSEIVHVEDFPKGKYIIGKYDKWFSISTINRRMGIFWGFANITPGIEINLDQAINYMYTMSGDYYSYFGVINDESITKIELVLDNGDILTETKFYDQMFIVVGNSPNNKFPYLEAIRGFDSKDNLIFEEINQKY